MQRRKFNIEIYNNFEWYIEIDTVNDFSEYPYLGGDIEYSFGGSKSTQDGKIARIFDIDVRDTDLELAKDDKRFKEVCDFRHDKHSFKGTFIDALDYIKKEIANG